VSFTNQSKNASSFTNQSKNSTTFDDGVGFLLKEDTFHLLLENGGKIVLDQSNNYKKKPRWANQIKH